MADLPESQAKEGEEVATSKEDNTRSFLDSIHYIQQYEMVDTEELFELYKNGELSELEISGLFKVLEKRGIHQETLVKLIGEKTCKKDGVGIDNKLVFAYNKTSKKGSTPSLKVAGLAFVLCLTGHWIISFVIGVTIGFYGSLVGFSPAVTGPFAFAVYRITLFLVLLAMTIFLLKRYKSHLLGDNWRSNLSSRLWVGLKWSIPHILFLSILMLTLLTPENRAESLKNYLLEENLSHDNINLAIVVLISATVLTGTFLEEIIFRGMIQQHMTKFIGYRKSVLIAASIFTVAHFLIFAFIPVSLVLIVNWFLVGIFAGFAFNKHNSCISAFVPHLVCNAKYIFICPLMLTF